MQQINFTTLAALLDPKTAPTNTAGVALLNLPVWVGYSFGSLFIVLGLALLTLFPKRKRIAETYKQSQLDQYNRDTGKNIHNYDKTRLFLPPWEKIKLAAPLFLGITFIIIGIAWIVGNALTTKSY